MKFSNALVVKLVDTKDLKSLPLAEASSSLAEGTIKMSKIKLSLIRIEDHQI